MKVQFILTIPAKEMNKVDLLELRLKEVEEEIKELKADHQNGKKLLYRIHIQPTAH